MALWRKNQWLVEPTNNTDGPYITILVAYPQRIGIGSRRVDLIENVDRWEPDLHKNVHKIVHPL